MITDKERIDELTKDEAKHYINKFEQYRKALNNSEQKNEKEKYGKLRRIK